MRSSTDDLAPGTTPPEGAETTFAGRIVKVKTVAKRYSPWIFAGLMVLIIVLANW